jgi:hypothetical protein
MTDYRVFRVVACFGAIAATVPYLTLKVAWLAGSSVGTVGHGMAEMRDMRHVVGNVLTVGMDLAAIVVALAFTCRWGQRLPAWLVLVPIWVGTGLLAPIAVGVPLGLVVQGFVGGSPTASDNGLWDWVYAIVYGGFTLQAIMLVAAFLLYARARWADVFRMRTKDLRMVRPLLADVAAVVAIGYGLFQVVWAVGSDSVAVQTVAQKTFWVAQGLLSVAGAGGLLALVHRWGRVLLLLGATWVGAGVMFASGLYAAMVVGGSLVFLLSVVDGLLMAAIATRLFRPSPVAAGVLPAVGQGFLDQAVGGQVGGRIQRAIVALHSQRDVHAGVPRGCHTRSVSWDIPHNAKPRSASRASMRTRVGVSVVAVMPTMLTGHGRPAPPPEYPIPPPPPVPVSESGW